MPQDVVDSRTGVVRRGVDAVNAALGALSLRSVPASEFFTAPESIPAERGAVIRTEAARFYIDPLRLVPAPARVTRIMFASTDRHDAPIALTGTVLTPTRPRSKRPDRGLVAFAVGTQGMVGLGSDYGIDVAPLLNDRGKEVLVRVGERCMFESLRSFAFVRSSSLTVDGRSIGKILRDPEFAPMVAEQQLGNGRRPDVDVMLTHSRLDDVVPYESGRALAEPETAVPGRDA